MPLPLRVLCVVGSLALFAWVLINAVHGDFAFLVVKLMGSLFLIAAAEIEPAPPRHTPTSGGTGDT